MTTRDPRSPFENDTTTKSPAVKWISFSDIAITVALPVLFAMSWLVRIKDWPRICRLFAALIPAVLGQDKQLLNQRIVARIGKRNLAGSVEEIIHEYSVVQIERKLLTLRFHRPGRWQPSVRIKGQEHIQSALRRQKGVIVWDSDFAFASLITKLALFDAGFAVNHLSHPSHGMDSSTKYGMRVLNPLISSVEERYLAARIELSQSGSAIATRKLMRCLNDNGTISITANDHSDNCLRLPFLDGDIGIAVGAPRLALKTGAALLPVFTLRDDDDGFLVIVDSEIAFPVGGTSREQIEVAAGDYLERLTPFVEQHPAQWRSWYE